MILQPAYPPNGDRPGGSGDGLPPPSVRRTPATGFPARPSAQQPGIQVTGNPVNIQRLTTAIEASNTKLRPFRARHSEAVKLFAGSRYGDNNVDRSPLNLLRLAVDVWVRQLISQTPRVLTLTRGLNAKVDAYELELALNHTADAIEY